MATIPGVWVTWATTPRIIYIPAPLTEITIEDLHDTVVELEATETGMCFPHLHATSGNDELPRGRRTGYAMKLIDALLAFEPRTGPAWTLCAAVGGDLFAVNRAGQILGSPLYPTAYVYATYEQSTSASLISGTGGLTKADVDAAVWAESATGAQVAVDVDFAASAAIAAAEAATDAAAEATLARKARTNRDKLMDGTVDNYVLFDDDGVTPLRTHSVTDKDGGPIVLQAGVPAERGAGH